MITGIQGLLIDVGEGTATIKVGNFTYQLMVPTSLARKLRGQVGEEVSLYTVHYLDGFARFGNPVPRLIGFETELEREFFERLMTVPDVGAKRALKALTIPIRDIAEAIENEDISTLKGLKGIGERTAKKIVADLKGQMGKFALLLKGEVLEETSEDEEIRDMGVKALLNLGYKKAEAERMVARASSGKRFSSLEELIKEVYRLKREGG